MDLLHEPPSNYGINRTTWIMADLSRVLRETGRPACPQVIRKITNAAGYRWRKARIVLTSSDPEYKEKLDHITPFSPGLLLCGRSFLLDRRVRPVRGEDQSPGRASSAAPGEQRVVPQWQKSRGCVIITAALELSGNQVTHFYSAKKNTAEMIRMMELLVKRYCDQAETVSFLQDAASLAISRNALHQRVQEHNTGLCLAAAVPIVEDRSTTLRRSVPQRDRVYLQWHGPLNHPQQRLQDAG